MYSAWPEGPKNRPCKNKKMQISVESNQTALSETAKCLAVLLYLDRKSEGYLDFP